MKILIVGAGPTGLSAALGLAEKGIICDVVEKREAPSALSRAVGIMPITRNHLAPSGVADAILSEGMPIRKFALNRGQKSLLDLDLSATLSPEESMTALPQNRTESLIAEAAIARGVTIKYGVELTQIETSDDAATVTFADGRRATYDWVIAADGKNSVVRTQLNIPYPGIDLPETWSIADVDVAEGFDSEQIKLWVQGADGLFILAIPIEHQRLRMASSTEDCLRDVPQKPDVRHVRRTGTFKISIRQAETYRKGRVLLAGDAAHCHSPVGGRGMNLGIDDGFAVARCLAEGTIDSYSATRHAFGAAVIAKTERMRKMLTSQSWFNRTVLTLVTGLIGRSNRVQRIFIRALTRF
ncbi:MAG: NAD(P)/FAD-dependent oxidoreductase [Synoicihabitans sp.]